MIKIIIFNLLFLCSSINLFASVVDPNATAETNALYQKLEDARGKVSYFGFYDPAPMPGTGSYTVNGGYYPCLTISRKRPYVLSLDFNYFTGSGLTDASPTQEKNDYYLALLKDHHERGGIITMYWYMYNWSTTCEGSPTAGNFTGDPVTSILPGGKDRALYLSKLDNLANFLNNLTDSNGKLIPVIFRQFQESDHNWPWWGVGKEGVYPCPNTLFIELWRDFITYLRDVKGVHNLLYVISPGALTVDCYTGDRWPGDDWVDIVGVDVYSNEDDFDDTAHFYTVNGMTANVRWDRASDAATAKGKVFMICEGYRNQNAAFREDYWTWLLDHWSQRPKVKLASIIVLWHTSSAIYSWSPVIGRADADNFRRITSKANYPWIEFLSENNFSTSGGTISGLNVQ